jgi:DNA (cytosine-5)-methyltransferase 1
MMRKLHEHRCLDLFCGAGGAARGLQMAGFHVTGIDNRPQPRYAGDLFIRADALRPPVRLSDFDLIWASPPCQRYTKCFRGRDHMRERYPDLIAPTRGLLRGCRAYVIENVPGSPVRADVVLEGGQFGLRLVRQRIFEVHGFDVPFCLNQKWAGLSVSNGDLSCVAGHGCNNAWNLRRKRDDPKAIKWRHLPPALIHRLKKANCAAGWSAALGIDWMTRDEMKESVPPAYAEHVGKYAMLALGREVEM